MSSTVYKDMPLEELVVANPVFADFFASFGIQVVGESRSFVELVNGIAPEFWEDNATNKAELEEVFADFSSGLACADVSSEIASVTVLPGFDKHGSSEACTLELKPGEVTCIVGPTGSGKSRLLADIEWLANNDTPTKRTVLINGKTADDSLVNAFGGKLIAQITQNMNFVLDMDVESFLMLHAQSKFIEQAGEKVSEVIALANELSGESFDPKTPVTFLSGGQSRALMIADVACIGQAPIVLIDEIENAGVDKRKALELLVSKDKIVLMATHDPLLILLADKRVVIKNGGMNKIIYTNGHERAYYHKLEQLDAELQKARNFFRFGNELKTENM